MDARAPKDPGIVDIEKILRQRFGFESFRPGQRESIEAILRGESVLSIQPTGLGKSLLYQLPSAVLGGLALVISPLLALMRDQLGHLRDRFKLSAGSINSDQEDEENDLALGEARAGNLQVLFIAPEQLDHIGRFETFLNLRPVLLVVDEAHCISSWGHDFRPAYRGIISFVQAARARNPTLRVLGLTATANQKTEEDIRAQLEGQGAPSLTVHRASMDRPNLSLAVVQLAGAARKLEYLRQLLAKISGASLIYCATRENTEIVAAFLQHLGLNVVAYHAGMEPATKRKLQGHFLSGHYRAIAATNALGMGIDKADLRCVIHYDVPGSMTAYYQEVGRAGRDGKPARGILLFDPADRKVHEYFIRSAQPSPDHFEQVIAAVRGSEEARDAELLGITAIRTATGFPPTLVTVVVAELVEQGIVRREAEGRKQVYRIANAGRQPDLSRYRNQLQVRTRDLEAMMAYGRLEVGCLFRALRRSLGDDGAGDCGRCNACTKATSSISIDETALASAEAWFLSRPIVIPESIRSGLREGRAALNGEVRPVELAAFLGSRSKPVGGGPAIDPFLMDLVRASLTELAREHKFAAIVSVPSRAWVRRLEVAQVISKHLRVPLFEDLLEWRELPPALQGDLLNNDQRRQNVDKRLTSNRGLKPPSGPILLFDDFAGSGATLREAARVLTRELSFSGPIVPFTIASIRWRLGSKGIVGLEQACT